jgi:hypothetical protein
MFKFLGRRREEEIFWTEWEETSPEFNMLFLIVTLFLQYLNFATFR